MIKACDDLCGSAGLSPALQDRLQQLVDLVCKWNGAINLVAAASLPDIWRRHVADSAQLFDLRPAGARLWMDLGSGGGFPGLVVGVLAAELAPDLQVELVDSDQRKCVFLQMAVQQLGLKARVTRSRIEALTPRGADIVSARALARLDQLCALALPHLAPGGICLFLKGAGIDAEVMAARRAYSFSLGLNPSRTDPGGVVAKLADLSHV